MMKIELLLVLCTSLVLSLRDSVFTSDYNNKVSIEKNSYCEIIDMPNFQRHNKIFWKFKAFDFMLNLSLQSDLSKVISPCESFYKTNNVTAIINFCDSHFVSRAFFYYNNNNINNVNKNSNY